MTIYGRELASATPTTALLASAIDREPTAAALVSARTQWRWRELDESSLRYAHALLRLGLKPGDRVASLMPNRTALLVHYLGCLRAGLVVTPLNYRYMAPEIDHALEVSRPSALLAHGERRADIAKTRLAGSLALGIILYGDADLAEPHDGPRFEELLAQSETDQTLPPPAADEPAVIFFTSGSTGKPKGVTHTHASLGWMLASSAAGIGLTASDVLLPGSSMSHIGGFAWALAALSVGAKVVLPRTFDGDELLPLLREHRPTVLSSLPSTLFTLVRDHQATHDDFRSLRLCRAAGDKVAGELEKEFIALAGFPIDEGYGMTEIGFALINPPQGPIKLGSVGRPMPGFAMDLLGADGRAVPRGTLGNLWVRSNTSAAGYWNNTEATQALFRDGWLDTGDEMKVDADGYFWFGGRKKQLIVHNGSNICPQEVEEAVLEHPAIASVGVVGVHDLLHGENVRAYVSLKPGAARPTAQDVIRVARARVGYKAPEEVIVLDAIPLNATGKVDRTALKQLAEEHLA